MRIISRCSAVFLTLAVAPLAQSRMVQAQIITDSTWRPSCTLNGPNYQIPSTLGQIYGKNLFHSFQDFNLSSGQSATFSGPASIANILSRVTGGNPSLIDGSLNSTIAGANFFFINPSGIVFGPDAQVNVGGSFVATTSDLVRLRDGGVFHAQNPSSSVLSSAPPSAFGFLNAQPAPILVNGSLLQVATGKAMSLIGGDIRLNGGMLLAPGGVIKIVSVGSHGEAVLNAAGATTTVNVDSFEKLGRISMQGAGIDVQDHSINSPVGGGFVTVKGDSLNMNRSFISARNSGSGTTRIDVTLSHRLRALDGSYIAANTLGIGNGGNITVRAQEVILDGQGNNSLTGIAAGAAPDSSGDSGSIHINAERLEVLGGAHITANTYSSGAGGSITIKANDLLLRGENSAIFAETHHFTHGGNGGNIHIIARHPSDRSRLRLLDGAYITADTLGNGIGGKITIRADDILLSGKADATQANTGFSRIVARTGSKTQGGQGGSISLNTYRLRIVDGAYVNAKTSGSGNGGNITVKAQEVVLDGQGNNSLTGIAAGASPDSTGDSGSIHIDAESLQVLGGAHITANTAGSGAGGSITIKANDLLVSGHGPKLSSAILAETHGLTHGGNGGNIHITARHPYDHSRLRLLDGAYITANTLGNGTGGNITIRSDDVLLSGKNSAGLLGITARSYEQSNGGNGGNIKVLSHRLRVLDGSYISANTFGSGNGGNITVKAQEVILDGQGNNSLTGIAAGAAPDSTGDSGSIHINAERLEVLGGAHIVANTSSSGAGGSIEIKANDLLISGHGLKLSSAILAETHGLTLGGKGGNIHITARHPYDHSRLRLLDGAYITADTLGNGIGGKITIRADDILLSGKADATQANTGFSRIVARTGSKTQGGQGGSISLNTHRLQIVDGAYVNAKTSGSGNGGNIRVKAQEVILDGQGNNSLTGIAAGASPDSTGDSGSIHIDAERLQVLGGAHNTANTAGSGAGGSITIKANDLLLRGENSAIFAETRRLTHGGNGGNIHITARHPYDHSRLRLLDGAYITANTLGNGTGGNIDIRGHRMTFATGGRVQAASEGAGNAGSVTIHAGDSIDIGNGSSVVVTSQKSDGGDIRIETGGSLLVTGDSSINAQAAGNGGIITLRSALLTHFQDSLLSTHADGSGGNINCQARFVIFDRSAVLASAVQDHGGNINIRAKVYIPSIESRIDASSQFGVAGNIAINSPNTSIGGSLVRLRANPLSAESYLQDRCQLRRGKASSFTVGRQGLIAPDPSAPLSSLDTK